MQKQQRPRTDVGRVDLPNGWSCYIRHSLPPRIPPWAKPWIIIALTGLGWTSIGFLIFLACRYGII